MFAVEKDSNENLERNEINRIKDYLQKKYNNQAFHIEDLKHTCPGKSTLTLLTQNICLQEIHVNLIYALIELYREKQLDIVNSETLSFRVKTADPNKAKA